jgi:hypothetical protein
MWEPIWKITKAARAEVTAQVVEYLLIPSAAKTIDWKKVSW